MSGNHHELWQVPLFWLRSRGRIGSVGVRCNACGHSRSWPIAELISRYGPQTLVSDPWRRWRCPNCGSNDVAPLSVGMARSPSWTFYRAAKPLINHHGDEAERQAAERADALLEEGDLDGVVVWRAIRRAIQELQCARQEGEPLN